MTLDTMKWGWRGSVDPEDYSGVFTIKQGDREVVLSLSHFDQAHALQSFIESAYKQGRRDAAMQIRRDMMRSTEEA